jgi:hypothetical protein
VKRLLLIPLLAACDGTNDVLDARFIDEVVGAPARSTEVAFLDGTTCTDLLAVPADEIDQVGSLIARRDAGFPIHPDEKVFENIPRGTPLVIHVVARDENGIQIGRGCTIEELPPEGMIEIVVDLHALPQCESDWRFLDIGIVIDTTVEMAVAFPGNEHIDELKTFVMSFEEGTRFSIITHGHTQPPVEYLAPTADRTAAADSIELLRGLKGGSAELFNSVTTTSRLLRSRAICPRRPVMLLLEAGRDGAANNIPVMEAKIALFATQGEPKDDIYVHGVYATENAKDDLEELFDGLSLTGLSSGTRVSVLQAGLLDARFAFDGLIVR